MDISPAFVIGIPVVVGLVALLKMAELPSRWAGLASLVVGVAVAYLVGADGIKDIILQGITMGLSASGLYSASRSTLNL